METNIGQINSTNSSTSYNNVAKNTLGKDAFLQLLVTQLKYQDPSKPMENSAFIAQMAQFTSLEQMNNLVLSSQMSQASGYIGKTVSWANEKNEIQSGKVSSVNLSGSTINLIINEDKVLLDKIFSISESI